VRMENCRGVGDWLKCLKCPSLCTMDCPIEGPDVVDRLSSHMEQTAPLHQFNKENKETKYN
jgi:hypothetical protein